MLIFYAMSFIPLLVGGIFWIFSKKVNWIEYVVGSALALIVSGIMHAVAIHGLTDDVETWSGQITQARNFSAWEEYYEYAVYRTEIYYTTDSKGNSHMHTREVFDHWEPTTRWHNQYWECYSNIDTSYSISQQDYIYFTQKFNDNHAVPGRRQTGEHNSRMIAGDPNDYVADNRTGWIQPVTKLVHWSNRVKAAPSVFSFPEVSPDKKVYEWPTNPDPFHSNRVLGITNIDPFKWDQMNARLGPRKKVNVIIVGFGALDESIVDWQKAKWVGGKKNDIVLAFGSKNGETTWSKVFGWSESEFCKSNLATILLTNKVDDGIIPLIEAEIKQNYTIKDWSKFDYLTIEPQFKHYVICLSVMLLTQVGFWIFAFLNDFDKDSNQYRSNFRSYRSYR